MNRTFAMIKPDATKRGLQKSILTDLTNAGFWPTKITERYLTREEAEWLYRSSSEKEYFGELVDYTLSHSVVLMVLFMPLHYNDPDIDVVEKLRIFMGPYEPAKRIPGTLRYKYGLDTSRENSIHGSDNAENASLEIQKFFGTF